MTGHVYAIASGKGGVGKTTTVAALGGILGAAGHRTVVVDADLGMANLASFFDIDAETTIHDVLAGDASVDDATVETDDLAVVPGAPSLHEFAAADTSVLGDVVRALSLDYEYVLVDTGAGLSHETALPLGLVDETLLVTTPEPPAITDTKKTAELVDLVGGSVRGVVVTRAREDGESGSIADDLEHEVLAMVPEDPAIAESTLAGEPLVAVSPRSDAALAYRELAAELADGEVPAPDAPGESDESTAGEPIEVVGPETSGTTDEGAHVNESDGSDEKEDTDDPVDVADAAGQSPAAGDDGSPRTRGGGTSPSTDDVPVDTGAAGDVFEFEPAATVDTDAETSTAAPSDAEELFDDPPGSAEETVQQLDLEEDEADRDLEPDRNEVDVEPDAVAADEGIGEDPDAEPDDGGFDEISDEWEFQRVAGTGSDEESEGEAAPEDDHDDGDSGGMWEDLDDDDEQAAGTSDADDGDGDGDGDAEGLFRRIVRRFG